MALVTNALGVLIASLSYLVLRQSEAVSLAIFDDVGAIVIIALFYTEQLSLAALIVALQVRGRRGAAGSHNTVS